MTCRALDIGSLIDRYVARMPKLLRKGVASRKTQGLGIPPDMSVGPVDRSGWVEWRVLLSTLSEADVAALEVEFGIELPPPFVAYLIARFHCLHQVKSRRFRQQILFPDTPTRQPFRRIRSELDGWRTLIPIGLVPFAEWGDGWGPMCFDAKHRSPDGDCPVVWLDQGPLITLVREVTLDAAAIHALNQPIFSSSREMLEDIFGGN